MALHGWPLNGSWAFLSRCYRSSHKPWNATYTEWITGGRAMASKATAKTKADPNSYEGFLRQQKHERNIAEKNHKDLILDMLKASATARDARAYLKSFGPQKTVRNVARIAPPTSDIAGLNLGSLFLPAHAADAEDKGKKSNAKGQEKGQLHVAIVKIRAPQSLGEKKLRGVMHTLEQLLHFGMQIVVIVDCDSDMVAKDPVKLRNLAVEQTDRIVDAARILNATGARKLDNVIDFSPSDEDQVNGRLCVNNRNLLLSPLKQGRMCVIAPAAFNSRTTAMEPVTGDAAVLCLTRQFAGISTALHQPEVDGDKLAHKIQTIQSEVSLDRVIVLDPLGGLPHVHRDRAHRYINLEQEYDNLMEALSKDSSPQSTRHLENLSLMKSSLALLPSSSSGFITTPSAVAKEDTIDQSDSDSLISTRSQRNPLIHNLLTNKPAVSFSLPQHRQETTSSSNSINVSTLYKRGMSLTAIPSIPTGGWTCPAPPNQPGASWTASIQAGLRNPQIDLPRLTHLINDSFRRSLDVKAYDSRTRNSLAGIIIAGDYQGAAIFTWESPPPEYNNINGGAPNHPWVPYLDKFAVLRSAQGTATADVLWNAMSQAFPQGFCWRSRTVNPVNKWYFERAQGSMRLEGTQWTMFWSRKGVLKDGGGLGDWKAFLGVCESVKPSWKDSRAVD